MSKGLEDVQREVPLKPEDFHILLAFENGAMHGYAILKEIERATGGQIRMAASPFYRKLKRLQERGIIEVADLRPATEVDDERRTYYRLTRFGTQILRAEASRLVDLAGLERVVRLASESG